MRKFTKEIKEAAVRLVEDGKPVKRVARAYNVDPAVIRSWRAELRDLGAEAFSHNGRRKYTKEFKEAAVRRLEEGTPLKEVARACRVHPSKLRQWRDASRDFGMNAFLENDPRTSAVIFRLTEDEHHRLKAIAKAAGARSLSDFARSRLLKETSQPSAATTRQRALQTPKHPATH
jgi:transposase-like protein